MGTSQPHHCAPAMLYIQLERGEGWKPGDSDPGRRPRNQHCAPWNLGTPLHLAEPEGSPELCPEELGEWALCSKSLAAPGSVMGLSQGTQVGSSEVSGLPHLNFRNIRI